MDLTTFCELSIKKVQVKTKDQNRNYVELCGQTGQNQD